MRIVVNIPEIKRMITEEGLTRKEIQEKMGWSTKAAKSIFNHEELKGIRKRKPAPEIVFLTEEESENQEEHLETQEEIQEETQESIREDDSNEEESVINYFEN